MENKDVEHFLELVHSICKQRDAIIDEKGYGFNVFSIMKMTSDEVKLHSSIIAELLNPNGSHKMGDFFLKKFTGKFVSKLSLNLLAVNVEVEKYIGEISPDKEKGGRIDILITDKENTIIIENKIHATDQEKQLVRYHNYKEKPYIIYLTLNGHTPSDDSCGNLKDGDHFHCLSYEKDIIQWLEECVMDVDINLKPILYHTVIQYINTLKTLTNQSLIPIMDTILSSAIKNNIEASVEIERAMPGIRNKFHQEFWVNLTENLTKRLNIMPLKEFKDPSSWDNYAEIIRQEIGVYHDKTIIFRLRVSFLSGIYMGITTDPESKCKDEDLKPIIGKFPKWCDEKAPAHIVVKSVGLNFWRQNQETISYMSSTKEDRKNFVNNLSVEIEQTISQLRDMCNK
ncbi:MAG: PD-(D/E)XK nuclease family protein [Bacteroidales bacterium]